MMKLTAHRLAILAVAGGLSFTAAPAFAATVPVAATVTAAAVAVPTLSVGTAFGSGKLSGTSAPTTSSSVTSVAFPTTAAPSSGSTTITPSTFAELNVTGTNTTSSTDYSVAASATNLTNTTDSSDTIPASDITMPNESGGNYYGQDPLTGNRLFMSSSNYAGSGALSTSTQTMYSDIPLDDATVFAFQPTLKIPENTPAGTYSGTITLTVSIDS